VRLVKYLRDVKNTFSCKSIILMTLLGQQVAESEATLQPERYADLPSALTTIVGKLAASLPAAMPPIMDPAGTGEDFSQRYRDEWDYANFRARMIGYATKIREAVEESDHETATELWQHSSTSSARTSRRGRSRRWRRSRPRAHRCRGMASHSSMDPDTASQCDCSQP
jgi:hypothetical protein